MERNAATALFIAEFAAFETHFVRSALQSLSNDTSLVETAEKILDLEARLQLLRRMAFVRNLDSDLIIQLEEVTLQAARLREMRDLARRTTQPDTDCNPDSSPAPSGLDDLMARAERAEQPALWPPSLAEIGECRSATTHLQNTLRSIAERAAGVRQAHADTP